MTRDPLPATAGYSIRQRLGAWVPVIMLAALAVAFEAAGEGGRAALRYERDALVAGEWWRLLTAHLVHVGPIHLAMNLAALGLLRLVVDDALRPAEWLACAAVAALGIDAGLYFLAPEVAWYVGLSGVLHGLLAAGALALLRSSPTLGGLLGGGLLVKLLFEQVAGPVPLTEAGSGGTVIVAAHLYGAAAGAAYGTVRAVSRRIPARL